MSSRATDIPLLHFSRVLLLVTCAAAIALTAGRSALAEEPSEDMMTFASQEYATHTSEHEEHEHRCPVCRSEVFAVTSEMVSVLGGRYTFQGVDQQFCPMCKVTTLSVPATRNAQRLMRRLRVFAPATREKIVQQRDSFKLALNSNNDFPFICGIVGLEKRDGTLFLEIE